MYTIVIVFKTEKKHTINWGFMIKYKINYIVVTVLRMKPQAASHAGSLRYPRRHNNTVPGTNMFSRHNLQNSQTPALSLLLPPRGFIHLFLNI